MDWRQRVQWGVSRVAGNKQYPTAAVSSPFYTFESLYNFYRNTVSRLLSHTLHSFQIGPCVRVCVYHYYSYNIYMYFMCIKTNDNMCGSQSWNHLGYEIAIIYFLYEPTECPCPPIQCKSVFCFIYICICCLYVQHSTSTVYTLQIPYILQILYKHT